MTYYEYMQLAILIGLLVLIWLSTKFIRYLKGRKNNIELWGTIFEGVTNKLIDLDPIKKPDVFIEKQSKKSGQAKDED